MTLQFSACLGWISKKWIAVYDNIWDNNLILIYGLQLVALSGNYVNFGVFELYGDRALADVLDIALKMTLSVPLADVLAFRKVHIFFVCKSFWTRFSFS